ncbi:MAG: Asp-tRNA(Asn)/Glu-tRNA(Gln) amidotransferase subunit GatC [Patescibacteria group bacterium]
MLTKEEIKHLAELSRLELTEKETEKYQKQLSDVLDYMDILKKMDTNDIKSESLLFYNINQSRKDKIRESAEQAEAKIIVSKILREAPQTTEDNLIKTKKVFG